MSARPNHKHLVFRLEHLAGRAFRIANAGWERLVRGLLAGTLLLVGAIISSAAAAERPNILWLVSEDNTTLLGCYGDRVARTPALDKLAREGVVFERCFTQPVCAPSRFSLITGLPPASSGPAHHMRAQGRIPAGVKGFPALLRQAGYYTANNAKTDYNTSLNLKETWNENGRNAHY
ncbi:MAG TPA: sulfatase-like hydrolase/transferase, partial [Clostridia bacterium]|nr:sulfatase-like hydrolase/transferase [Clostridia bacterium]